MQTHADQSCAQTSSLFQCQLSSDQSGQVYTPNIPNFYFSHENAADFRTGRGANLTTARSGFTYIFTIPAESAERNCTGRVVGIQYCYQAGSLDIDNNKNIFNLLHLNRNGFDFTVNSSFTEQTTPRESFCTNPSGMIQRVCCDTATLGMMDQFQLSSTSYTFAVMLINNNVRPLAFAASSTNYRYEQLQASLGISVPMSFTLAQSSEVNDESLLLLRFILGKRKHQYVQ